MHVYNTFNTHITKLMYEYVPNCRRNLGRPRKRWREKRPCKRGQTWNSLNHDDDDDDDGHKVRVDLSEMME
jgi:hypothetical protein